MVDMYVVIGDAVLVLVFLFFFGFFLGFFQMSMLVWLSELIRAHIYIYIYMYYLGRGICIDLFFFILNQSLSNVVVFCCF